MEPEHPPINIRSKIKIVALEDHNAKSAEAKPVVEMIVATWNIAILNASDRVGYKSEIKNVIPIPVTSMIPTYAFISLLCMISPNLPRTKK